MAREFHPEHRRGGVTLWQMNNAVPPAGHGKHNIIPGVKYVIAVSSGKGGVGKSTVSVNFAVALALTGAKVGLLDADIYGPNIPMMMGVRSRRNSKTARSFPPKVTASNSSPWDFSFRKTRRWCGEVRWSTPPFNNSFATCCGANWITCSSILPPGTGDAQLTLTQLVPLTGAVTVTTPQEVALHDVRKGMMMFQKVNVPLLGIVENMSYYLCGHCGERTEIFSHGGGERAAAKLGVPFLGRVPIDPAIRDGGDSGNPIVVADPASPQSAAFREIAQKIIAGVTGGTKGVPPIESLLSKIKNPFAKT